MFLATDINLPGAVDWVMMQSCFNNNFMLVLEKQEKFDEQQFYAIVQFIGSQKQADNFAYRLISKLLCFILIFVKRANFVKCFFVRSSKKYLLYCYRLELNGHRRRLTWEATPRSIHDGIQSAIRNSDCLVFDDNIAQLFADSGNLGINVTISMC